MTYLPDRDRNNLVSFLRQNQPLPPQACPDLERQIMESLEPRRSRERKRSRTTTWTLPSAIATGFLFTTVSFGVRTPRIAVEPQDIENFLVNNWQDTLGDRDPLISDNNEAYWLLPTVPQAQPAVSLSAQ